MRSNAEGEVSKDPQSEEAGDISGITQKPWGSERLIYLGDYAVKILRINAGKRTSYHYHEEKDETIFLHKGTMLLEITNLPHFPINPHKIEMIPGEFVQIFARDRHRFTAHGQDVVLFEASAPHLTDVVRLEDDYGRKS